MSNLDDYGQQPCPTINQVDELDSNAIFIIPPNRSVGGTPIRRSSPAAILNPSRPNSIGRNNANTSNPRDGLLRRVSYEELMDRPSSNHRTRTPMRYESPLNANAFRPNNLFSLPNRTEGQRVTVRPLAGAAIGTSLPSRRDEEVQRERHRSNVLKTECRSSKQGPSHHKIRRWNNDSFVGVAAELARNSRPGVAENLILAQADAPMYRSIFPEPRSSVLNKFLHNESLTTLRDQFADGEIGHRFAGNTPRYNVDLSTNGGSEDPELMIQQIPERLKNVVIRACSSSENTKGIVDALEDCLKKCFLHDSDGSECYANEDLANSLLFKPNVTKRVSSGHTTVRFAFDASSSKGGFHRLLLHAICQFHGLTTSCFSSVFPSENGEIDARLLIVSGKSFSCSNLKLSACIR